MEPTTAPVTPAVTPGSAPVADPVTPAPAAPAAPVTQTQPVVEMEKGGFLDEVSFANWGMITVFTIAMATVIYCSWHQLKVVRDAASNNRKDIDELRMNYQTLAANYQAQG